MSLFSPRTFPEIYGDMVARIVAVTPLTDVNYGSVMSTMLEAAAQEDDEQYFQMLEIIRGYSLDTTTGTDLEDRAFEYGIVRETSKRATTFVTIGDSSITKIFTGVYSGLPGAPANSTGINGDSAVGFPESGAVIIGRGTPNAETVSYSSITDNGNYVTFNLSQALAYDHGTDEDIILSQGGNRLITAGAGINVPASDISGQIDFTLDDQAVILDGESEVTGIAVTANLSGSDANVPVGAISQFDSPPFATVTVKNPARVTNGADSETDEELRDRIKATIQSLSRGTGKAITTSVIGVVSPTENKRVVSASIIEPTNPTEVVKLYIDDGTGFIPAFAAEGFESVVPDATGGEKFLRTNNTPLIKAFVETQNEANYALFGGEVLFVEVGGEVETITFQSTDFESPGAATAQEVLKKINSNASLFESRVSSGGSKLRIFARQNSDEQIRVAGGTANTSLNFPTDLKTTAKLYLLRDHQIKLLSKDGVTSSIESGLSAGYDMSVIRNLCVVVDGKKTVPQLLWFMPTDFVNASSATAKEVVDVINARLTGASALASSSGTRVRLQSNIERSLDSKLRVVDGFTNAYLESIGTFTDKTSHLKNAAIPTTLFASYQDYLYLGHSDVPFASVWADLSAGANVPVGLAAEYWDGTVWKSIGVNDGTEGFTRSGFITFSNPYDWQPRSVNSSQMGYFLRLQRNTVSMVTVPIANQIRVCSANTVLGFTDSEKIGQDRDYTLNRFIGQIELVSPLIPNDKLTLGSVDTRAQTVTRGAGPYGLSGGETFGIEVDGVSQNFVFQVGDFFTPGAALPQEVVNAMNARLVGVVADLVDSGTRVRVRGNAWNNGSVKVLGTTANNFLQFPTTKVESLTAHVPAVESVSGPFVIPPSREVIVVVDNNLSNNFTTPLYKAGKAGASSTASTIVDTGLQAVFPTTNEISGFDIEMTSGALLGQRRTISGWTQAGGQISVSPPFSSAPVANDTFQIIPKNASQVAKLWNNRQVTLLTTQAEVSATGGGLKVQIASLRPGEAASVLVSGGSGNSVLGFSVQKKIGVDAYRYYTGLAQLVQWTVDGRDDDDAYEGVRAAGVQVEVADGVTIPIRIELDVTTREGISLLSIANDIKSAVSAYVNTLPIGGDVIVSDLVVAARSVGGVFDVKVTQPTANIAIADNEIPRVLEKDIIIG